MNSSGDHGAGVIAVSTVLNPFRREARNRVRIRMRLLLVLLTGLIWSCGVQADAARGREIAALEHAANHGFRDLSVEPQMELTRSNGKSTSRSLRLSQIETVAGTVKTLVVFDLPKAIADTALLTWSNVAADDDQWLYLPAIKRMKKIVSKDRSGPFVGSTFAYEDLADYAVDEFRYLFVREEVCESLRCGVIERRPVDPFSGYLRQLVWVDTTDHRIRRIEFFDHRDTLMKTLEAADFAGLPWARGPS
ncbi:MAG: outer membrane lipoprotein-sorting protein, partial [Gammaproteobacteria bacterium]|nr:outer membrane lipoprotein-sorting protein [Gammaproteobacteria bacterium]